VLSLFERVGLVVALILFAIALLVTGIVVLTWVFTAVLTAIVNNG
jgi:hypothetical protein